jgi:hypothetical protein
VLSHDIAIQHRDLAAHLLEPAHQNIRCRGLSGAGQTRQEDRETFILHASYFVPIRWLDAMQVMDKKVLKQSLVIGASRSNFLFARISALATCKVEAGSTFVSSSP